MEKFTKEQSSLFTVIACVVMLLAFFFVKLGMQAPVEYLSRGAGWFGVITLICAMLAPVYLCLYVYRDQKVLEPLKPIFGISPKLAYSLPLIALGLVLFAMYFDGGWPVILYALAAGCVVFIGSNSND